MRLAVLRRGATCVICDCARSIGLAVFAFILGVSLAFGSSVHAQSYSFSNIDIEGAIRIEAGTILTYAGLSEGTTVTAGQLNAAYQAVLASQLFESVVFEPLGSTLLIRVQEYPTINSINFEGNRRVNDDALEPIVQSKPRDFFNPTLAEEDAARITQAYEQTGRMAAGVDPVIIRRTNNRVDLVFEIREGRVSEVERIGFVGNRNFSDRRLRRVLESKQAGLLRQFVQRDTFVADRIEFDKQLLRDFYMSRGFVDFEIISTAAEFSRERDAFFVTFTIREGQQFRYGEITATTELPEIDVEEFESEIRIRSGKVYTPVGVDTTITRLERLATQKDLDFIRVDPRVTRNDQELVLDIDFQVVMGPRIFVERIDIDGNATTLDRVIRARFTTVEGDPYNPREIRDAAARIRALGFFSTTDVEARDGSSPDQVVINVDVEEQPTGTLAFGASYSSNSGLGANVSFTERNFLGRGQDLSFAFDTTDATNAYRFGFVEPLLLGRDLEFGINVGYQVTDTESNTDFSTSSVVFRPSLSFPMGELSRLSLRYSLEQSDLEIEVSERSFTLCADRMACVQDDNQQVEYTFASILDSDESFGKRLSSAIGYTYGIRTLDSGLNPDEGVLFRFGQDLAGLGGDAEYLETTALFVAERQLLGRDVTLRAIVEGGVHHSFNESGSRYTDRFSLTGRLRGFEVNGIGPRDYELIRIDEEPDLSRYRFARGENEKIWTYPHPGMSSGECHVKENGEKKVESNSPCHALVQTNTLRGNYFAVAKLEAEFPLGIPEEYGIRGAAFLDVGSVWGLDNKNVSLTTRISDTPMDVKDVGTPSIDDGFNLRAAAGVSLLWNTPIGPLRFNFSRALVKEDYDIPRNFELTVSTRF